MSSTLKPENTAQLREAVEWAVGEKKALEVVGSGSKRAVGCPVRYELTLDLSAFSGVRLYEPEELVLSARAATSRAEAEKQLAANGQEFAFEPPDFSRLLGTGGSGTLGGMIASNLAGPRRIKAGAARDHFLGFSAVSGRGEIFKSGGRVMKNVTGYDLSKLLAGSWGTLAVMSNVTLKVLPAAKSEATLVLEGLSGEDATRAMSAALQSCYEVSGAAHLPAGIQERAKTLLRLEGVGPSIDYRFDRLSELLAPMGTCLRLDEKASKSAWIEVRDVLVFAYPSQCPVWRISVPPAEGYKVADAITHACGARVYQDWGGGLIWCEVPDEPNACAPIIRGAVGPTGGHATLIRASQQVRAAVDVFQPQAAGLAAISKRLKTAFDPRNILNPGRMYPEA